MSHDAPDEKTPTIRLRFRPTEGDEKPVSLDISALAITGRTLFCASDETAAVERLVFDQEEEAFADHRRIHLPDYFDLPGGEGEIDIEGLAVDGKRLWITGSHALKRRKPKDAEDPLGRLHRLRWDANRSLLGYLPLKKGDDGLVEPSGKPARMMKVGRTGRKSLRWLLRRNRLLRPFLGAPAKENGFDVEGLAVFGKRVVVGLRGPVLGRHAFLVSMEFRKTRKGYLKPRRIDGARYRLHAIDLGGFGIRDLLVVGEDLFILAGPTQAIEGLARIYALEGFDPTETTIPKARLRKVTTLPMREECDHAEGIAAFEHNGVASLLVAHDNPAPERRHDERNELLLDAVPLDLRP